MNQPNVYTFTADGLLNDVQSWIEEPESNFGWLMRTQTEGQQLTARRIATRETTGKEPTLIIEYTAGATEPIMITEFSVVGNEATLSWTGGEPPYQVQNRSGFAGDWSDTGDPVADPSATVSAEDVIGFYRVGGN